MTDREKLIEIIGHTPCCGFSSYKAYEHIADNLIANGVTIRTADKPSEVAYNLSPTETQWIPAAEKLPEEHESIFARYYGTKNWMPGMFCTVSDTVIAAVLYEDGKRTVKAMHTQDGKWHHPGMVGIKEVTHWMPMPLPPADLRR